MRKQHRHKSKLILKETDLQFKPFLNHLDTLLNERIKKKEEIQKEKERIVEYFNQFLAEYILTIKESTTFQLEHWWIRLISIFPIELELKVY